MCGQKTAMRRRRQAANGYKHLGPLRRPRYAAFTTERAARKAAKLAELRRRGLV